MIGELIIFYAFGQSCQKDVLSAMLDVRRQKEAI
jgi:hypothetical protein